MKKAKRQIWEENNNIKFRLMISDDNSKKQLPKVETKKPEAPKMPQDRIERSGNSTSTKTR